jgi:hypothetical protein
MGQRWTGSACGPWMRLSRMAALDLCGATRRTCDKITGMPPLEMDDGNFSFLWQWQPPVEIDAPAFGICFSSFVRAASIIVQ